MQGQNNPMTGTDMNQNKSKDFQGNIGKKGEQVTAKDNAGTQKVDDKASGKGAQDATQKRDPLAQRGDSTKADMTTSPETGGPNAFGKDLDKGKNLDQGKGRA